MTTPETTHEDPTPAMRGIVKFSEASEPRCDHESCDLATCAWDVCASPYWEERRTHALLLYPEATSREIHARM